MLVQGEPVQETCPVCNTPVLFRKGSKTGSSTLVCINPSCKFKKKEDADEEQPSNG